MSNTTNSFTENQVYVTEAIFDLIDNVETIYNSKLDVFQRWYNKGFRKPFSLMGSTTNVAKMRLKDEEGKSIDLRHFSPTYYRELLSADYKNFCEFKRVAEFMPEI